MKSVRVLGFIALGGASAIIVGALFLARLWPHITSTLGNAVHAVTYACQVAWQDITSNQLAIAVAGAAALGLFLFWLGYNTYRAVRMFRLARFHAVAVPVRVFSIAADAGLDASRLSVVADTRAYAMTMGMRWPEVVVSTQVLRVLTEAQFRAVLEHEAHHVRQREPLRRALLSLALLWVPFRSLRHRLREQYVAASEVEADEQVADQQELGSALLQLVAPPIAAAGFSPLDARVERLVNPHFQQSGRFALVFAAVALVIAANALVFVPRSIATVFANHESATTVQHLTSCREEHERMLQSQANTCGEFSTPQTCGGS